ncbi:unnamed protein product [Rotaria sp. Silwood2]|nr:unnamed protein product [Rotaria sp. Silwood2]CAF4603690.1 unnamed protein product [Rotaria sp. Silwood2]
MNVIDANNPHRLRSCDDAELEKGTTDITKTAGLPLDADNGPYTFILRDFASKDKYCQAVMFTTTITSVYIDPINESTERVE